MKKDSTTIIIASVVWGVLVALVYANEFLHGVLKVELLPESLGHRWVVVIAVGLLIMVLLLWRRGYVSFSVESGTFAKAPAMFGSIDEIFEAEKNDQFEKVIRLGTAISRTLYIEGHHKLRHDIGKVIQEAAMKTQNRDVEMEAYIDYIGWSLVLMRGVDNAKAADYINHGIALAQAQPRSNFWLAKGIRHLGAIKFIAHDNSGAEASLKEAKAIADDIDNDALKKEMIAGIDFDLALVKLKLNDTNAAEAFARESRRLREAVGDKSRICRMFALEGKIAEARQELIEAKNLFSRGLEYAKKNGRKDEVIRNHIGLARVLRYDDPMRAKQHYDTAMQLLNASEPPVDIYGEEVIPML